MEGIVALVVAIVAGFTAWVTKGREVRSDEMGYVLDGQKTLIDELQAERNHWRELAEQWQSRWYECMEARSDR